MRKLLVWCSLVLAAVAQSGGAARAQASKPARDASSRVALVIGNSKYVHASALSNPANDAADMAEALRSVGVEVLVGIDLDKPAMDRQIRDFSNKVGNAGAAIFFYAGHGLQVAGTNYLMPVDAQLSTAAALDFEMVRLDLVQRAMERAASANVIFLDACRDNPLSRSLARSLATRSAGEARGLARTESGVGTLISFSTQPGNVALDGSGRNSPFTTALIRQIRTSEESLNDLLIQVRREVIKETNGEQVPWEHSAMTSKFYFPRGKTARTASAPPSAETGGEAERAWTEAKASGNPAVVEAFIRSFPNTFYAALAADWLEALKSRAAVAELRPSSQSPAKDIADLRAALLAVDTPKIAKLLESGWNPNTALDAEKNTALHLLPEVCEKSPSHDPNALADLARRLVAAGARRDIANQWGDRPPQLAGARRYCGPQHPLTAFLR